MTEPTTGRRADSSSVPRPERLKQEAREELENAKTKIENKTRSELAARKSQAADAIEGVARALRSAATELDSEEVAKAGRYTHRAAEGLDRFAGSVRETSLPELVRQSEDFARRQPAIFFGAAMTAGFALARFLKSSADGEDQKSGFETRPAAGATFADAAAPRPSTTSGVGTSGRSGEAQPHREGGRPWNR